MNAPEETRTGATGAPRYAIRDALRWLLAVSPAAGRTLLGKAFLLILLTYVFLWSPDIDFLFMSLFHHRSIITHSILPGLIFLLFGRRLGAAPAAGAMIGTSVHLSCDLLSPMVGYAQVWLPAPFKQSLGPLSYLWLAANAVSGFAIASLLARAAFGSRVALPLTAVVGVVAGVSYGVENEDSIIAAAVVLAMLAVSLFPEAAIRRWLARPRAAQ